MEKHISQSQVYAEVFAVLSVLDGEYIRKIPRSVLDVIAEQRDKQYKVQIDETMPLEEQNLSDEAIALVAALKLDYWCETEVEKKFLQSILNLNEERQSGRPLSEVSKKMWIEIQKIKARK